MGRTSYYFFNFSNGERELMTKEQALEYAKANGLDIVKDGLQNAIKTRTRLRDGFNSGWNIALGQYVGGQLEYNRILKERGLVEVGNEAINKQAPSNSNYFQDESLLKDVKEIMPELSDRELDALKTGEIAKDTVIDAD